MNNVASPGPIGASITSRISGAGILLLLAGCSGKSAVEQALTSQAGNPPEPEPVAIRGTVMETDDGRRFFGYDSGIDVRRDGDKVTIDVNVTVGSGRDVWTSLFRIAPAELPQGRGMATIKQVPMDIGIGWAERMKDGFSVVRASSGTISYGFADGRMTATVASDSPATSGSLAGGFQVRCLVAPSELGLESHIGTPSDGIGEVVVDRDFQTEFCRTFAP